MDPEILKKCPHCQMAIYDEEALLCHHCGNSLGRTSGGAMGTIRAKWILIGGALVIIISWVLLSVR